MTQNSPRTIKELIDCAAEKYSGKACIRYVSGGEDITKTYGDMKTDSYNAAYHILSVAAPGSHIGIIGKTSYSYISYYNGIFISGCTAVPLPDDISGEELAYLLKKADVSGLVCDRNFMQEAGLIPPDGVLPVYMTSGVEYPERETGDDSPDRCALIMFTSGTTGDKKGVMLSSYALISNVMFKEMSYEGDNVALNVLPMYHIFSFSCDYLKNLKDGVTICLNGDGDIRENLLKYEPTFARLVPMIIETLLKRARAVLRKNPELTYRQAAEKVFGKRLKNIIASGAYMNPEIAEEYEKFGISVRQGYGMTETGPRIAVPNGKTSAYSVGAVIDICDVSIVDGEIRVKSPSLMTGYYKDPEATKAVFDEEGRFCTGDIGYVADDGQLYVTGRKKNLIILSNGENVSPEEIEKRFLNMPQVEEVMVYGEKNMLTAEFYISPEYAASHSQEQAETEIEQQVKDTNSISAAGKTVAKIKFRGTPFAKTSTGKIMRMQINIKES